MSYRVTVCTVFWLLLPIVPEIKSDCLRAEPLENYVFSDVEMVREFVEGWDLVQVRRTIQLK